MKSRPLGLFFIFLCVTVPAAAVEYTGQDGRNPFGRPFIESRPGAPVLESHAPAPPPFVLEGIIWVPGKPRALINGKRVVVGAMIDGAKVVEIRKKDVKILFNEQEIMLHKEGSP